MGTNGDDFNVLNITNDFKIFIHNFHFNGEKMLQLAFYDYYSF